MAFKTKCMENNDMYGMSMETEKHVRVYKFMEGKWYESVILKLVFDDHVRSFREKNCFHVVWLVQQLLRANAGETRSTLTILVRSHII